MYYNMLYCTQKLRNNNKHRKVKKVFNMKRVFIPMWRALKEARECDQI